MDLEICFLALVLGCIVYAMFALVLFNLEGLGSLIASAVSVCMVMFGVVGMTLYGLAPEKIESQYIQGVAIIEGVQYIQYTDPDSHTPVILNVNEFFKRSFTLDDMIQVTIYSKGPYNGIYHRPKPKMEVLDTPTCDIQIIPLPPGILAPGMFEVPPLQPKEPPPIPNRSQPC